jgi:hypothetical protein
MTDNVYHVDPVIWHFGNHQNKVQNGWDNNNRIAENKEAPITAHYNLSVTHYMIVAFPIFISL